jgi:hypothetical protein
LITLTKTKGIFINLSENLDFFEGGLVGS